MERYLEDAYSVLPPAARGKLRTRGFDTAKEAAWICPTCGVQQGVYSRFINRWMRRPCPCECEREHTRQLQEMHNERRVVMAHRTYGWLGPQYSTMSLSLKSFDDFDVYRQPDAFALAQSFAANPRGTLILHGTYGTGKTHLLTSICQALRDRVIESRFCSAPKLFRALQEAMNSDDPAVHDRYQKIITQATNTPLLVLDDIDKAGWTKWREERYWEIINDRVDAELPIAISTNRLDDLQEFVGGAVASRLKVGQIAVQMVGTDYRAEL